VIVAIAASVARRILPVTGLFAIKATAALGLVTIVAAVGVAHHPFRRFGAANQMTLVRAALAALIVGLIGEPPVVPIAAAATVFAVVAEVLDAVDGRLARRSGLASAFGARFDMEVDALLILALAALAWELGKAGVWVLLSGLLRYGFVAAGWVAPWLSRPLPPSRRRQAVCVVQIAALCVAVSPLVGRQASAAIAAVALVGLSLSFLVDVVWLWRSRRATPMSARVPASLSSS
jgi:phosphatidylglycerophosphate synthase